jgi:hypothetical protein
MPDLIALTCKAHMLQDTKPNIKLSTTRLPTYTQLPAKHPWEGRPHKAQQPQCSEERTAKIRPPGSGLTASLTCTTKSAGNWTRLAQTPRRHDNGKLHRNGGAQDIVPLPPLTGIQHPNHIAKPPLKHATLSTAPIHRPHHSDTATSRQQAPGFCSSTPQAQGATSRDARLQCHTA